jgi:hypothetical protein
MPNNLTNLRIGDDLILERMCAAEQGLLTQADALDMKASYLLVALVFLAQLSTIFLLRANLPLAMKADRIISCVLLVVAGILLLFELGIKGFKTGDAARLESWRDDTVKTAEGLDGYKNAENPQEYLRARLVHGLIISSKGTLAHNDARIRAKVCNIRWAYWMTFMAFGLDVIFLIYLFC